MQYNFTEENSVEVLEECFELCQKHFYELNEGYGVKPFDVDWPTLKYLLSNEALSIVVARVDGRLIGYFMNILSKDFLTSTIVAKELAIYVEEEYRNTSVFFKMHKFVEKLLVDKGITEHFMTFVQGHNDKLPLKLGFVPIEVTYKKCIGG